MGELAGSAGEHVLLLGREFDLADLPVWTRQLDALGYLADTDAKPCSFRKHFVQSLVSHLLPEEPFLRFHRLASAGIDLPPQVAPPAPDGGVNRSFYARAAALLRV